MAYASSKLYSKPPRERERVSNQYSEDLRARQSHRWSEGSQVSESVFRVGIQIRHARE